MVDSQLYFNAGNGKSVGGVCYLTKLCLYLNKADYQNFVIKWGFLIGAGACAILDPNFFKCDERENVFFCNLKICNYKI